MNKWFGETFLPSLFAKTSPNNPLYITERQAEMCEKYMNHTQHSTDYGWQTVLECEWDGRTVSMFYRGKYRMLYFGSTESEYKEFLRQCDEKRYAKKIERFKKHPERIPAEIEKIKREIECADPRDYGNYGVDSQEYIEIITELQNYITQLLQIV